ncbi:MCE family protein [Thalassotalea sp. HSM 43]|nr:MCE family protein [Thalassotalea sp. HSM 43]
MGSRKAGISGNKRRKIDMTEDNAIVSNKSPISSIWLLPVIAALIGIWLLFKSISEGGVDITVKVDSAEGIVANKTEVRYKGFVVGLVKELDLEDLNTVLVTIEMNNTAKRYLSENSMFWLVKPDISLSGVSGLDTVITGNYFEFLPVEGEKQLRVYEALKEPPPESEDAPGLHVVLHAKELGSIGHGSAVFYKQIQVGEVYGFELADDAEYLKINVLIDEDYEHLVKLNTRFWNASGIEMTGDLSGFKIRTQSLASIVGGGIAFYTPETGDRETTATDFTEYPLFEDFDAARAGVKVVMNFPRESGIKAGITKVIFEGVEVGLVEDFVHNSEQGGVTASVIMDPRLEPYLLSEMQFWLVKPNISLSGVTNVDRLLSGSFVAFRLGGGHPTREFDVLPTEPPLSFDEEGLHLNIKAEKVDSMSFGSPVFYKNLKVGTVQNHYLNDDQRTFNVHLHIEPEYEHLVNSTSVFYEQGGFEVNGSLRSFTIRSAPLQAILAGGVAFHTVNFENGTSVEDGHHFNLNRNLTEALNIESITIDASNQYEFVEGITKIKYGDKEIGQVRTIQPGKDLYSSVLTIGYQSDYKELFKESTKIWIVEPKLSSGNLAGVSALLQGSFLQVKPGHGEAKTHYNLLHEAPANDPSDPGLQLELYASKSFGIERGTSIFYKAMPVGQVDVVEYSDDGLGVKVSITIEEKYRKFIGKKTRFFNASGINATANLRGLKMKTESLDAILRGGLAFSNDYADLTDKAEELDQFPLYATRDEMTIAGNEVEIEFDQAIDLLPDAHVKFNGYVVGRVTDVELNEDLSKTIVTAMIKSEYPSLTQSGAKFWFAEPSVSVANVKDPIAYFIGNFIKVIPGSGDKQTNFAGLTYEPAITNLPSGLNLTLTASRRGSLNPGNPVYYRQMQVGKVLGIELNQDATGVVIYANIADDFSHLVRRGSKFYNASGIDIDAGVFSGVKVTTESVDTILSGGIGFATPESDDNGNGTVESGQAFKLNETVDPDWLQWRPALTKP